MLFAVYAYANYSVCRFFDTPCTSHIKIRHAYDFSLCFPHELLMSFLNIVLKVKSMLMQEVLA